MFFPASTSEIYLFLFFRQKLGVFLTTHCLVAIHIGATTFCHANTVVALPIIAFTSSVRFNDIKEAEYILVMRQHLPWVPTPRRLQCAYSAWYNLLRVNVVLYLNCRTSYCDPIYHLSDICAVDIVYPYMKWFCKVCGKHNLKIMCFSMNILFTLWCMLYVPPSLFLLCLVISGV